MTTHTVGTREEWLAAPKELLEAEQEHLRRGDELARRRQELPWVLVEKEYVVETADGRRQGPRRALVMSGSSEGDPEGGEGSGGVAGVVTRAAARLTGPARGEHADGEVA
jgi:uncharacterized protein DUF899